MAELPDGAALLATYPEGRVWREANGALVAEGVYDEDDAPLRGRVTMRSVPPPKPQPLPAYGTTIRGRPIVGYREMLPWEIAKREQERGPVDDRIERQHEARAAAYDRVDLRKRRPVDTTERVPPSIEDWTLRKARRQAETVMAKWNAGIK